VYKNIKIIRNKIIILPAVLYGCKALSLILREDHGLRVLENSLLRRIFGPKRDEVTGDCKKLYDDQLHYLYSLPNLIRMMKSRRMKWASM
jgi:hypothetical protein